MELVFNDIYNKNLWHSNHKSGGGADDKQTIVIRKMIPQLLKKYNILSVFDCPCGDLNWIKKIFDEIANYTGGDIVDAIINNNKKIYPNNNFVKFNLCEDIIPYFDLILCRDLFVHLNLQEIHKAIKNIKKSNCKYLLTTTFINRKENPNIGIQGYHWRPLNLQIPPFSFPEPLFIINENCTEGNNLFTDKSLALWEIKNLPDLG